LIFIIYTMTTTFHIFVCSLNLNDELAPTYINITDDNEEAMKYIMSLFYKFTDVKPFRLYKGNKNLQQFKEEFYNEFKDFELEELEQGRVYVKDVMKIVEMYLNYHHKDLEIVKFYDNF